ncbi:DNA topoisomerase I, mitochondrial-like [Dendronephthya gigantea]|uniref:DNA topoisomerase I, mitochondrial-like n=1 Tax=Dendronephthya gigantea TaxID=151771 RepID=UPI00106AD89C|nr:DNA topoisomerase I, mitochondrial-like [Dendronephthya gigantea]
MVINLYGNMVREGMKPRGKFPDVEYSDACAVGANRDLAFESEAFFFAWNQTTRLALRNISSDFLVHLYTKEPDSLWAFSNLKRYIVFSCTTVWTYIFSRAEIFESTPVRMETNDFIGAQMTEDGKDPHEKKRIKLDRSRIGADHSQGVAVSNGVKCEVKHSKKTSEQKTHNEGRLSLKRPADNDDIPLVARSKHKLSLSLSNKEKSPSAKDSQNDVKKIKKIKQELSESSKLDKPKKIEIKKNKGENNSTVQNRDSIKKHKSETANDSVKKAKLESSKLNSDNTTDGVKKIKKLESGLASPNKNSDVKKVKSERKDGLLSPKMDGIKKVEGTKVKDGSSVKIKIEKEKNKMSPSKTGDRHNNSKDSSRLTSKVDGMKKAKLNVSSTGSPKVDGMKKNKVEANSSPDKRSKSSSESENKSDTPRVKKEAVKKIKTESDGKTTTDDTDDDVPLAARAKPKITPSRERKRKGSDSDDNENKPLKKLKKKSDAGGKDSGVKKEKPASKAKSKKGSDGPKTPEKGKEGKGKEKKEEEEVWKWWEEEKHPDGIKWLTLEHKGPYFPPEYEPLPDDVNFYYNGNKVKLSVKSEEVAGFYAKMLDHDYTSKKIFNDNFFEDWRKEMTDEERELIKHLSKCDFKEMHAYYTQKNEERKNMTKEEKQVIKEKNEAILQEYGFCMMDNHKERVGNFKIEPPGLFRGRGDHPKQGKLKKRLKAKDVIINIGKDSKVPDPPEGQRWKAIQHDNKVTWLACWVENIQGSYKYVMLNPTSRIKGEKDWQKYETARKLKGEIGKIRADYTNDWKAKEMRIRQRGVALYFIDKLALRAGHEKDEDTADTVGCCSLRYEHIKLHKKLDDKEYVVEFDFLGKDSIHYHNIVPVEKRVYKNLELFKQGKSDGDDLFDRLSTTSLNKYLSELMEGLSAKVFRTYNASMTLQDQLNKLEVEDNVAANVLGYNRANRAVAILCNHQRSAPKTFEQSMSNLQKKIDDKRTAIKDAKNELKDLKHEAKGSDSVTLAKKVEKKKTAIERLKEQLFKLEVSQTDKNENKEIALGTSKLNYLDPRISIAWCLKNKVPIEKIYNKTQRQKFAWAIDMTEEDFVF